MLVTRRGFVQPALGLEHGTEVGMIGGLRLVDCNCLTDHPNGGSVISSLKFNHSEQVQAVCMIGIDGQDLPINLLGFAKSSGLMLPQGNPEHSCDISRPRGVGNVKMVGREAIRSGLALHFGSRRSSSTLRRRVD